MAMSKQLEKKIRRAHAEIKKAKLEIRKLRVDLKHAKQQQKKLRSGIEAVNKAVRRVPRFMPFGPNCG